MQAVQPKISEAVLKAADAFVKKGGGTYLDFAVRAKVSKKAAAWSTWNMARSGRLCAVARKRVPGIAKPLHVYVPAYAPAARQLCFLF